MIKKTTESIVLEFFIEKHLIEEIEFVVVVESRRDHARFFLSKRIDDECFSEEKFVNLVKKDSHFMFEHLNQLFSNLHNRLDDQNITREQQIDVLIAKRDELTVQRDAFQQTQNDLRIRLIESRIIFEAESRRSAKMLDASLLSDEKSLIFEI